MFFGKNGKVDKRPLLKSCFNEPYRIIVRKNKRLTLSEGCSSLPQQQT